MKIKVNPTALLNALRVVTSVIPDKALVPATEFIYFSIFNKSLTMTANNLDTQITSVMAIDVEEDGFEACMPGLVFLQTISSLKIKEISIEIKKRKNGGKYAYIKAGKSSYKVEVIDPKNFPKQVLGKKYTEVTVKGEQFIAAMKRAVSSVEPSAFHLSLAGVNMFCRDKKLLICGFNNHLSCKQVIGITGDDEIPDTNLGRRTAAAISNIPMEGFVKIKNDGKFLNVQGGSFSITGKLVESKPAVSALNYWDKKKKEHFQIGFTDLEDAFKRINVYAKHVYNLVECNVKDNEMYLIVDNDLVNLSAREYVPMKDHGVEELSVGINQKEFITLLNHIECESINFHVIDHKSVMFVEPTKQDPEIEQYWLASPVDISKQQVKNIKTQEDLEKKIEKKGALK